MEQGRKLVACRLHSYCTSLLQAFSSALDSKRYGQRNRNNVISLILLIYMSSIIATMLQDHVKKKNIFFFGVDFQAFVSPKGVLGPAMATPKTNS